LLILCLPALLGGNIFIPGFLLVCIIMPILYIFLPLNHIQRIIKNNFNKIDIYTQVVSLPLSCIVTYIGLLLSVTSLQGIFYGDDLSDAEFMRAALPYRVTDSIIGLLAIIASVLPIVIALITIYYLDKIRKNSISLKSFKIFNMIKIVLPWSLLAILCLSTLF